MTETSSRPLLLLGDCLDRLREMPDNSVDSVVTDPPYGLSFMGKKWDYDVPSEEIWRECLRVLKPGGHLLAFAGTRTQHRMAVRIEDAGFEIRDIIAWVYGSGFPKSLDVSKAIDKAAGYKRTTEYEPNHKNSTFGKGMGGGKHGAHSDPPATVEANQWKGFGTALKPALEPITVARKPLGEKTVAANVLKHGTGALNIDGCRVATNDKLGCGMVSMGRPKASEGWDRPWMHDPEVTERKKVEAAKKVAAAEAAGRWPANLIHDGSDEVVGLFPVTGAAKASNRGAGKVETGCYGVYGGNPGVRGHNDAGGSAARFFYCAKASKKDRDEGCEEMELVTHQSGMGGAMPTDDDGNERDRFKAQSRNHHPTVKPTALMRYLCRLVTPPEGIVLDPFMGSGSTGKAAVLEGFQFIGIERDEEYMKIAESRIAAAVKPAIAESA